MTSAERPRRYSSPLREEQAQRTRELILDALTALLAERRADEVSTRQIAERAGVSQPTVYRHFPDRRALIEGLADRVDRQVAAQSTHIPQTLEDWAAWAPHANRMADDHAVEATAEAVLNADPRRYSEASRRRTEELRASVARSLPDLDAVDQHRVTALLRILASAQAWLRMREEFGLTGADSGALVGWAIRVLTQAIRDGDFPDG
jgi:AcrR family transcriptional regulator